MSNKVEVSIAGRKYKIACPKGQESALFSAAAELDKRVATYESNDTLNTPEQAMMMVALNLANDLIQSKKAHKKAAKEAESQIALLQSTIEQAVVHKNKSA